jgi:hypothetical protein
VTAKAEDGFLSVDNNVVTVVAGLAEIGESVQDVVSWGAAHGYHCDADSLREGVMDLVISGS